MEWIEKVKSFFAGEKKDLTDPEIRKEAFFLLSELHGTARWDEFAMIVRQTIITRHPVQKPSFAERMRIAKAAARVPEPGFWLERLQSS